MTELTIDPASGLPTLPEGYFWRVKAINNQHAKYTLELQLRCKRWIFSVEEKSMYSSRQNLFGDATYLARAFYNARHQNDGIDKLVGDYPPKKWTGA